MIICSILTKLLLYSSSIKDTEEVLVLPEVNLENHPKIYNILKGIVKKTKVSKSEQVYYYSVF